MSKNFKGMTAEELKGEIGRLESYHKNLMDSGLPVKIQAALDLESTIQMYRTLLEHKEG